MEQIGLDVTVEINVNDAISIHIVPDHGRRGIAPGIGGAQCPVE
jgi:hypothetical protein